MKITESEILDAIKEANEKASEESENKSDGAYTTVELAELAGVSKWTISNWLRPLVISGEIEVVKVYRKSVLSYDNRGHYMPGYKLVKQAIEESGDAPKS